MPLRPLRIGLPVVGKGKYWGLRAHQAPRHEPLVRHDEQATNDIEGKAIRFRRYGYRRLTIFLRSAGWLAHLWRRKGNIEDRLGAHGCHWGKHWGC